MMSVSHAQREAAVLQVMLPRLQAEGFEVFLQPSRDLLPAFLGARRPEAIALRQVFAGHPDWELRVVYAPPLTSDATIPVSSRASIEAHPRRVAAAFDAVGPGAALVIAWSAFEAAGRRMNPDALARPRSTDRLLEVLASEGHVTPDEADRLRPLGQRRNEAAHGRLDVTVSRHELQQLADMTRTILEQAPSEGAEADAAV